MCDGILDPESFSDRDLARDIASWVETGGGLRERLVCSGTSPSADPGPSSEGGSSMDLGTLVESTFSESEWSSRGLLNDLSGWGLRSDSSGDRDKGVILPVDSVSQDSLGRYSKTSHT